MKIWKKIVNDLPTGQYTQIEHIHNKEQNVIKHLFFSTEIESKVKPNARDE